MANLRFRDRHLHRSVYEVIKNEVTLLGWATTGHTPMGVTPFTFVDFQPELEGQEIAPNTIAVSTGTPSIRTPAELGDGLFTYYVPVFIDIYGEKRGIADSVGGDIMEILRYYRLTSQIMDFTDPDNPVPSDDTWFVEDEQGPLQTTAATEAQDIRRYWRLCRFQACVEYMWDTQANAPVITFTETPPDSQSHTASSEFTWTVTPATPYAYSIDGADFVDNNTGGVALSGLSVGTHTFVVKTTVAGPTGSIGMASHSWILT